MFKNVLVIQKTSKLKYLLNKYGTDLKNSLEYEKLFEVMNIHNNNCNSFIEKLNTFKFSTVDVVSDSFLDNDRLSTYLKAKKYDIIFSLGGDGTFLRTAQYIDNNEQLLVGVNTDGAHSFGFYCSTTINNKSEDKFLDSLVNNKLSYKYLNKLEVQAHDKTYSFINDLYFGEKFLGRISKYKLEVDNKRSEIIKSSGIIFSTCKSL
jgi:NAD kinase